MIDNYQQYTLTPHATKRLKQRFMVYGGKECTKWLEKTLGQATVIKETKTNKGIVQDCKINDVILITNKSMKVVITVYPESYYKYKEELKQYESAMSVQKSEVSPEIAEEINNTLDRLKHRVIQRTSKELSSNYQVMADVHTTLGRTKNYKNFEDNFNNLRYVKESIDKELAERDKLLGEIKSLRL